MPSPRPLAPVIGASRGIGVEVVAVRADLTTEDGARRVDDALPRPADAAGRAAVGPMSAGPGADLQARDDDDRVAQQDRHRGSVDHGGELRPGVGVEVGGQGDAPVQHR